MDRIIEIATNDSSEHGLLEIIEILDSGTINNSELNQPLIYATLGNGEQIKITLLQFAYEIGNIELFKILLDYGANPNILYSGQYSDESILPLLSKIVMNVIRNGGPEKSYEFIELLLEYGADVNYEIGKDIRDIAGGTVLHLALECHTFDETDATRTRVVSLLLKFNPNLSIVDRHGMTALDIAIQEQRYDPDRFADIVELFERHIKLSRIQRRFRDRLTQRKERTLKSYQQLQASRLPVDYDVSRIIGERLSRIQHNPEVATRMREEPNRSEGRKKTKNRRRFWRRNR